MNAKPTAHEPDATELLVGLGITLLIAVTAWAIPASATWTHDGTTPSAAHAVRGTVRVISHREWKRPSRAYPLTVRRHMPAGSDWWIGGGMGLIVIVATTAGIWRRIDVAAAQATLGRRPYDLRGARPRSWARPRDAAALTARKRRTGCFTLGTLDGRSLASDPEAHVAVVAPTRAGKTTRCVIPWLLEHDGPAIVTSTKTDVLSVTRNWRQQQGQVTVWNPFGQASDSWTPLTGCKQWSYALRQAQWLADAAQEGDSEITSYWRGEAARLVAPLLHAAAVADGSMADVLRWIDGQDVKTPVAALRSASADPAICQLSGVVGLDPRNRGSVYMSAGSLVAAYRYPEVQAATGAGLTVDAFLDGKANTLYVIASSRQQRALAPLVVAMISSLLHGAAERSNNGTPLDPTLRVVLDETANIAPLRDLPAHLSQAAGHGIRIATMWQSLAQLRHRYQHASDDILANSTAKLFMGPITDENTRRYVQGAVGHDDHSLDAPAAPLARDHDPFRGIAPATARAEALQQLARDRALLIEGRTTPAVVRLAPWWKKRWLARRGP